MVYRILLLVFLVTNYAFADEALQDPTRPQDAVAVVLQPNERNDFDNYVLKQILISKNRKLCIINDKLVKVGDIIGEYKVKSIDKNEVVIENTEETIELRLPKLTLDTLTAEAADEKQ